jgi:hypothetical protein
MRWTGHVACIGEKNNAYRVFGGKVRRKLGWPRHMCEDNIKLDLRETGWGGLQSSGLGQGLLVSTVLHIWDP